jgi:hypothetical protein
VKRKKYFGWEQAFHFVWQGANREGIWNGDASSLAAEFDVSEDDADAVLGDLCKRRTLERLYTGSYIIVNWRETDDPNSAS